MKNNKETMKKVIELVSAINFMVINLEGRDFADEEISLIQEAGISLESAYIKLNLALGKAKK